MDAQLLQKYVRNECAPAEARAVLSYLATDEGQKQLQQILANDLQQLDALPLNAREQVSAQQIFERIQSRKQPVAPVGRVRPLNVRFGWLAAAAVSLLLLATGGWWFYQQYTTPQLIHFQTAFGQTRRLVLPDQSIVTLNGNTSITYPEQWPADRPREVSVEGEAFFEVVHTRNHQRFTVHLPGQMNVEVLGTRFNVYTRKSKTKVVLNEGRIQMKVTANPRNHLVMIPGEMFFADTKTKVFYKRAVNALAQSSWRTNRLLFEGTTLADIAQQIEDTYGVDVQIRDPELRQQRFSGTIPNQNIETILDGLSKLFDLKISRQTNLIIIE